jgi:hypothetical protein
MIEQVTSDVCHYPKQTSTRTQLFLISRCSKKSEFFDTLKKIYKRAAYPFVVPKS